jgi:hypothetical protein
MRWLRERSRSIASCASPCSVASHDESGNPPALRGFGAVCVFACFAVL